MVLQSSIYPSGTCTRRLSLLGGLVSDVQQSTGANSLFWQNSSRKHLIFQIRGMFGHVIHYLLAYRFVTTHDNLTCIAQMVEQLYMCVCMYVHKHASMQVCKHASTHAHKPTSTQDKTYTRTQFIVL